MPCKPQHATSGEILRGAARRLTATKFRVADRGEICGSNSNEEKKIRTSRNLDNVNKIWDAVALVIESSLLSAARGVRIESLGTFTLDAKNRTRFFLSSEFVARHRLLKYDACTGASLAGGSVNTKLNISKVAATASRSRPEAERVLDAVLRSLRQCLASGRSVTLSFHPVAEFSCVPSRESRMRYLPGFRASRKAVTAAVVRARVGAGRTKSMPTPWAAAASGLSTVTDAAAAAAAAAAAVAPGTDTAAAAAAAAAVAPGTDTAAAAAAAAADIASTGESRKTDIGANSRVAIIRAPAVGNFLGRETASVGIRRPFSASTFSSASHTHGIMSNRPKSSYGGGMSNRPKSSHGGSRGVLRANTASRADERAITAESTVDNATKQPSAWKSPRNNSRRIEENIGGLKTASYYSCAPLGWDVFGDDAPGGARWVSHNRRANGGNGTVGIDSCNGECHVREEEWLANLLRQQTLAQTSEEGLRRVTETLRLTHADTRGCDERLSGRTLLQALRDVGVKLTSDELADMTSVFRRQRDARVSLRALLSAIGCHQVSPTSAVDNAPGLSPARVRGWREGGSRVGGSPPGVRRKRDGRVSGTPRHQEGAPAPLSGPVGDALSAPSCNESRAPQDAAGELVGSAREHKHRQEVEKSYHDDGYQDAFRSRRGEDCSSAFRDDNVADTTFVVSRAGTPAVPQLRRECWHSSGEGGRGAKVSAEESAIAELATIVYSPPRSLEGLIHVLQASKVAEQPAIACAAMSARLCQLRPGLGRKRAQELSAAAACRRLDEKVCLVELHALLERRFGRNGFSSDATAAEKNTPARSVVSSSIGLSCAAVDRVRRNLLSSKGGLGGLKVALSKASVSAEGSLTKEELRRALTTAGGPGCPPPTAKDIDDMFILFSCQTPAGVNGGRVEAATVLRGLRGDLSPPRERIVREIFRNLLNVSRSERPVHDGVGASNDQGTDRICSHPRRNARTKSAMHDVVHVEVLKNAYCSGGGNGFTPMNDSRLPVSGDRGNRSIGGWFSPRDRPGNRTPRTSLAGGSGWGVGAKSAYSGVTVEQFLEHYRDVSAGIDGDDAFEAFVRGSWLIRPHTHPEEGHSFNASDLGRQSAAGGAGGAGRTPRSARRHDNNRTGMRHEDDPAGDILPGKIAQASSRTDGVPLSARDGGTASDHQSLRRENVMGKTVAVVHQANYSAPAVSRAGGLYRIVLTPPRARLAGEDSGHTGSTNAGSVREREGPASRSTTAARRNVAARRDVDDKYQEGRSGRVEKYVEGRSARVAGATSQAGERGMTEDAQRRTRPATHGTRWSRGNEKPGDRGSSRKERQERVPQREEQHEQGNMEELTGYRVEPAGFESEQQQATTASFRMMVTPTVANVRTQDQPPADIDPARENNLQQRQFQSSTCVAQNAANIVVLSTGNTNQAGRSDSLAQRAPSTSNTNRAGKIETLSRGRGYNIGGTTFDRSAAAVRVQRVFRGHKGRRCAGAEGRKRASQRASEREARMERERPHAASIRLAGRLPRPKLPSTYGF